MESVRPKKSVHFHRAAWVRFFFHKKVIVTFHQLTMNNDFKSEKNGNAPDLVSIFLAHTARRKQNYFVRPYSKIEYKEPMYYVTGTVNSWWAFFCTPCLGLLWLELMKCFLCWLLRPENIVRDLFFMFIIRKYFIFKNHLTANCWGLFALSASNMYIFYLW